MSRFRKDSQHDTVSEHREKLEEPPRYKVLLHNDDYTTKVFVVEVLVSVFNKSPQEAYEVMWHVHRNGVGVCGVYTYEVAETKVNQVLSSARGYGFPLKLTLQEE